VTNYMDRKELAGIMAKPGSTTTAWLASSAAGLDSWSGVGAATIHGLLCFAIYDA
jgi:hypothetical protein